MIGDDGCLGAYVGTFDVKLWKVRRFAEWRCWWTTREGIWASHHLLLSARRTGRLELVRNVEHAGLDRWRLLMWH